MKKISDIMGNQTLLPIIQADNESDGVAIAQAMSDAGLTTVEVVLRSKNSAKCITAIKTALPQMKVSAGTVIDTASLDAAISAGADFIVTPAVTERLLTMLVGSGLPVLPGVSNVSDIVLAREHGFREMKLFPASLSGGPAFLKAVGGLFKDTVFCPTGGVSPENFNDYLSLNNVFAAGGTWVAKPQWVADKQWHLITEACSRV